MNLIDEQDITCFQIIEDRGHFSGFLDGRSGGDFEVSTHFIGNNSCKSRFAEAGGTVEQNVI